MDKGLISKVNKQLTKVNIKKKKWADDQNRHFSSENIKWQQAYEKMLSLANY